MIRVLTALPHRQAVVSTEGLQRVVLQPSGRVVGELLTPDAAAELVATLNSRRDDRHNQTAEAIDYDAVAAEDLTGAPRAEVGPAVLAVLEGCVVVDSEGMYRLVNAESQTVFTELNDARAVESSKQVRKRIEEEPVLAISYAAMAGEAGAGVGAAAVMPPAEGKAAKREPATA